MITHRLYTALTGTERAQGIDVSRYNKWFDPALATQPIHFVVQKVTEGTTYTDLLINEIWQGVQGIPVRGAYHYQRSSMSWALQADHFLNTAARYDYHFHALDLEEVNNVYSDAFFADSRRMLDYWQSQTGKPGILYTNGATYKLFAAAIKRLYPDGQTWLDALQFWYAWPSLLVPAPILPTGRSTWTFWQYRWDGPLAEWGNGIPCDVNLFNGTVEQLHAWAGVVPPTEEPMPQYVEGTVKADPTLNVRSGPATTYAVLGSLPKGAAVKGWLENGWILFDYNGADGYVMATWVTYAPATPPADSGLPEFHITSTGNDYYPAFDFTVKPK